MNIIDILCFVETIVGIVLGLTTIGVAYLMFERTIGRTGIIVFCIWVLFMIIVFIIAGLEYFFLGGIGCDTIRVI